MEVLSFVVVKLVTTITLFSFESVITLSFVVVKLVTTIRYSLSIYYLPH